MKLSNEDREALLVPCSCGHTLNEHGSLLACWACDEEGDDCATNSEALLAERMEAIVTRHVEAALNAAADTEGWISVEAEKHLPDTIRGGCVCGFCAWSPEHVAVMAFREGFRRHRARIVRSHAT